MCELRAIGSARPTSRVFWFCIVLRVVVISVTADRLRALHEEMRASVSKLQTEHEMFFAFAAARL